jgi:hypothetical protein
LRSCVEPCLFWCFLVSIWEHMRHMFVSLIAFYICYIICMYFRGCNIFLHWLVLIQPTSIQSPMGCWFKFLLTSTGWGPSSLAKLV